jgi:hypothetical protein
MSLFTGISTDTLNLLMDYSLGKITLEEIKKYEPYGKQFVDLIMFTFLDKNSGALRERITCEISGCHPLPGKHGLDAVDKKTNIQKEIKPKVQTYGKTINGGGNFNDMTCDGVEKWNKLNYGVITSGFSYDGHLLYVLEFPFSQLYNKFKKIVNNPVLGRRVTGPFSYLDYIDCDSLIVHYIDIDNLTKYNSVSKKFFNKLDKLKREIDGTNLTKFFK